MKRDCQRKKCERRVGWLLNWKSKNKVWNFWENSIQINEKVFLKSELRKFNSSFYLKANWNSYHNFFLYSFFVIFHIHLVLLFSQKITMSCLLKCDAHNLNFLNRFIVFISRNFFDFQNSVHSGYHTTEYCMFIIQTRTCHSCDEKLKTKVFNYYF
jgi:hypothetical protein